MVKFVSVNLNGWWNSNGALEHLLCGFKEGPDLVAIQECFKKQPKQETRSIYDGRWRAIYSADGRTGMLTSEKIEVISSEVSSMESWNQTGISLTRIDCRIIGTVMRLGVISVYRKPEPSVSAARLANQMDRLKNCINRAMAKSERVLVAGDFNAQSEKWGSDVSDRKGRAICRALSLVSLLPKGQIGKRPTFESGDKQSTVDAIFASVGISDHIKETVVLTDELPTSDHHPLMTEIVLDHRSGGNRPRWRYQYGRANWNAIKADLHSEFRDWNPRMESKEELDEAVAEWTQLCQKVMREHIPKRRIRTNSQHWWTGSLEKQLRIVRRLRQRHRRHPENVGIESEWKKERRILKKEIRKRKAEKWAALAMRFVNSPKHQLYEAYSRLASRVRFVIPDLLMDGNEELKEPARTDHQKATAFGDRLESIYNRGVAQMGSEYSRSLIQRALISIDRPMREDPPIMRASEVRRRIQSLKRDKAPGLDEITAVFLKQTLGVIEEPLSRIMTACLKIGHHPSLWKAAVVVPIPKPGKLKSDVASYRPITLLSQAGKILEQRIDEELRMYDDQWFSDTQCGFRSAHGCEEIPLRLIEDARRTRHFQGCTRVIQADEKGAYDRVWLDGLLYKFSSLRPRPKEWLERWLRSCLMGRTVCVRVSDAKSVPFEQKNGLPQGLAISPRLYNIYTRDLIEYMPENVNLGQFADDITIWVNSVSIDQQRLSEQAAVLQESINGLIRWNHDWNGELDRRKSHDMMLVSPYLRRLKGLKNTPIFCEGEEIPRTTSVRILGCWLDSHLTMKQHVQKVCERIQPVVAFLSYVTRKIRRLHPEVPLTLYRGIVAPMIEYCGALWSTVSEHCVAGIAGIQKRFAKLVAGASNLAAGEDVMIVLGITPIAQRIRSQAADMFEKCIAMSEAGQSQNQMVQAYETWKGYAYDWDSAADRPPNKQGSRNRSPLSLGFEEWSKRESWEKDRLALKQRQSDRLSLGQDSLRRWDECWDTNWPALIIYTDGSSKPNPGFGGIGIAAIDQLTGVKVEISAPVNKKATNIQCEILAITEATRVRKAIPIASVPRNIYVVGDCKPVLLALCGITKPKRNLDLISQCVRAWESRLESDSLSLAWTRGHRFNPGNERADFLAGKARRSLHNAIGSQTNDNGKIGTVYYRNRMRLALSQEKRLIDRWDHSIVNKGKITFERLSQVANAKEWAIVWDSIVCNMEFRFRRIWWRAILPSSLFYDDLRGFTGTWKRCKCGEKERTFAHAILKCERTNQERDTWLQYLDVPLRKMVPSLNERTLRRLTLLSISPLKNNPLKWRKQNLNNLLLMLCNFEHPNPEDPEID